MSNQITRRLGAFFCALLSMTAFAADPAPGLLYSQGYEISSLWPQYLEPHYDCYPNTAYPNLDSFSLSTRFANEGTKSLKNTLVGNIVQTNCGITGDEGYKVRQEVFWGKGLSGILASGDDLQYNFPQNKEYWIGNAYYFPSDEGSFSSWWPKSDLHSIFQIHGSSGAGQNSPEVFVRIGKSGKINIENRYTTASGASEKVDPVETHSFVPDQWNSLVVYTNRRCDSNGVLRVWVNGTLSMEKVGSSVCVVDFPRGYVTGGAYIGYSSSSTLRNETYVHYEDSFRLWRGAGGSYAAVDPFAAGDPPPPPPPAKLIVNADAPITSLQDTINIAVADVDDITSCVMNDSAPLGVKFDYTTGTSGKFSGVDTSGFTTTGTVKCYDESVTYNYPVTTTNLQNGTTPNTEDSLVTGLDVWGYTTGRLVKKILATSSADAYWLLGASYPVIIGDRARVDITYSCTGTNCNNLYFDVGNTLNDNRIRMKGTAGALTLDKVNDGHGTAINYRNYTLGDDAYRIVVYWTVNFADSYKLRAGWNNSVPLNTEMHLHEVIFRKNWTTEELVDEVTYGVVDSTPPGLSGCSMTNLKATDGTYTARIGCDADEVGGTDYAMITTSNTAPTVADVKAGTGAIWSVQAPANTAEIDFEATGMEYRDLWSWIVRCDAATVPNCPLTPYGATFDDGVGPGQSKKIKFANNYDGAGGNRLIYTRDVNGNPVLYPDTDTIDRLVILGGDPRYESPVEAPPVLATFRDVPLTDDGTLTVDETDVYSGSVNELEVGTPKWFMLWNLDGSFNALGTIKPIAE